MTNDEAIEYLTRCADGFDPYFDCAVSMAVSALSAQQTGGWINVKDRLPPPRLKVLVWFSGNRHFDPQSIISFRIPNSEEIMYENEFGKATHWQPLPEPPKKAYMK